MDDLLLLELPPDSEPSTGAPQVPPAAATAMTMDQAPLGGDKPASLEMSLTTTIATGESPGRGSARIQCAEATAPADDESNGSDVENMEVDVHNQGLCRTEAPAAFLATGSSKHVVGKFVCYLYLTNVMIAHVSDR